MIHGEQDLEFVSPNSSMIQRLTFSTDVEVANNSYDQYILGWFKCLSCTAELSVMIICVPGKRNITAQVWAENKPLIWFVGLRGSACGTITWHQVKWWNRGLMGGSWDVTAQDQQKSIFRSFKMNIISPGWAFVYVLDAVPLSQFSWRKWQAWVGVILKAFREQRGL